MEMDLKLTVDGTVNSRLLGFSAGINYNTAIVNGGTLTFEYIGGRSQEISSFLPNTLNSANTPGHLRIAASSLGSASGIDVTIGQVLTLGRYRVTNSVAWTSASNAQLWLQNTASGRTATAISATGYGVTSGGVYAYSTSTPSSTPGVSLSQTTTSTLTLMLNAQICSTLASQTASSAVTCFGGNNGTSTITMSPTPTVSAITYTVDGGSSQNATLSSGAFTVSGLTAGGHTIVVSNSGCSDVTATGISISQPAVLSASSSAGTIACNGGSTTIMVSATGGTAPYTGTGSFTVSSGSYSYTVTDAKGCSSTTTGTVSQPAALVASSSAGTISCNGGSTTVTVSATGGTAPYTGTGSFTVSSGSYSYTVTDANGCSSTTTGTVSQPAQLTNSTTATACDSYVWSVTGQTYTSSGTHTGTTTNGNGCTVNETLNLTINHSSTSEETQVACDSYSWNGQTYTASGDYTHSSTNASGCPNVATLHLTINHSSTTSETQVACDVYRWHGIAYSASGDYTYSSTNASGCTNVATLHLTINHSSTSEETQVACTSYTWHGVAYTASGDYTYSSTNASGCTNVATLHLTINHSSTTEETQVACTSYTWHGVAYTASGDYTFVSTNASGCDNVATLHLTINNSSTTSETQVACDSYTWHGTTYTASGDYTYNSTNTSGCTNVATLHLTINRSTTTSETQTACNSYTWNGNTYTTSGTYTYSSQNASGCTNVATLHLTINSNVITTQPTNPTICALATATATVTAAVAGATSTTTYQWFTQTPTGTTWTALSNGANYAGVTTPSLTIIRSAAAVPVVGTKYRLQVTVSCGSTNSNVVTLQDQTVLSKAAIVSVTSTLSPALTTCSGNTVNLSLAAGSVGNIQWQSSTDGTTWNNFGSVVSQSALSVTNAAISFNTGTLTQTTWFRAVASNGVCTSVPSAAVKITVSQPTSVGTLSSSTTVCTGTGAILNLSAASGTISWQKATVVGGVVGTFAAVAGNTTSTLATGNLTATTAYQVVVSSPACSSSTSNVVTVTVSPASTVKTISGAGAICNGDSKTLTLATGSIGSIQWQANVSSSATAPTTTDANWSDISGATNPATLTVTPITTTWYRVVSTSSPCSSIASAAVQVVVNQPTSVGTLSAVSTSLCTGNGTTLNLDSATGTIAWQKASVVGGVVGSFAAVAGNVTSTLTTPTLTATTAYRVVVSSGVCSASTSNVVIINVSPASVIKAVSLATTGSICSGSSKTLNLASGSVGSIQWQSNVSSSTTAPAATDSNWTNIAGATSSSSISVSPTTTTWYRAVATSSPCSQVASAAVQVVVNQPTSVGTLSSDTTVCSGSGTTLNLGASSGTITWQKASVVVGVVGSFGAVSGNVTSTLTTGSLTATTAYRVVMSSGACSSTSTSNVVTVTVSPLAVAKTISGNTGATTLATAITSCTTISKVLTYATTGSVGAIQWQYYNGGSSAVAPTTTAIWTNISGANAATYNAPSLGQTGNVWFRVKVSSSPCSDAFTPSINVWFKACPTIARIEEAPVAAFSAIAYPSPFTENFTLNVTTPSEDKVQVMVYDMIGKLVDQREVSPADAATLEIGDRFPSGVYNVIVTQGENTKTLRVIKRQVLIES